MLSLTGDSKIQGLFNAFEDFPVLFKEDLIFKEALHIQAEDRFCHDKAQMYYCITDLIHFEYCTCCSCGELETPILGQVQIKYSLL